MARLHAAVAADVEVPALFGGNDADVLALRLGAFAGAARHTKLDLVWSAQALVAVLQLHRQAHAVLHAVAAPGRSHAALHGAQRFAIRVAGLESGGDQLFPDQRQLFHPCAKHVHARTARDLGVQPVLLRHLAHSDQPVGRDFAAGHAWHHGIGAVLLDVAQVVVVAVLQAGQFLLEHKLVPARREHAGRHGLADVAAHAFAVAGEQVFKSLDLAHAHQVVDLLARVREVLAKVVVHRQAPACHLGLHDLGDQGYAAAAGGARLGAGLEVGNGAGAVAHGFAEVALGDVVARADLRRVGQRIHAQAGLGLAVAGREDQELGVFRQGDAVERHLQQRAVFGRIADQHRAQQLLAVFADDDPLVDLAAFVHVLAASAVGRLAMGVANARHIHAHELELGAHVCASEGSLGVARNMACRHAGHVVAGGYQAEGLFVP